VGGWQRNQLPNERTSPKRFEEGRPGLLRNKGERPADIHQLIGRGGLGREGRGETLRRRVKACSQEKKIVDPFFKASGPGTRHGWGTSRLLKGDDQEGASLSKSLTASAAR